jgi:hypothetical protein
VFKPGDIIIYLTLAALIIYPFLPEKNIEAARMIKISSDSRTFFAETSADTTFTVGDGNDSVVVEVKDRMVRIKNSTCRDKYCEKKGWLKETGHGEIVCMPNRVIVSFVNDPEDEIDAVTE